MEPRASIIIVTYNKREDITRCLQSVRETAYDAFEVIVVDNASVDGSADAAAAFSEVTVVRSSENTGFGGGCNLGASRARGEHLVFLNPDTKVDPGWLKALIKPLDARPLVGLVTSKILMLNDPRHINTCGNTVHLTGLTLCRGLGAASEEFDRDEEVDAVSGAAFAIRRQLFQSLGGFDETMFLYMEDTDLSLRARLAGWESRFAADSIVYHDYSLKMFPLKVFYQERNRYVMLLKNFKWLTLLVMLPALIGAEVITWGFVLLYDRANSANKLRAYQSVIDNWWTIMGSRRTAQAARRIRDHELLQRTSSKLELENAKQGSFARFAERIIDPFFYVARMLTLGLVRW